MIKKHQPTIFGRDASVLFTSVSDGSMRSPFSLTGEANAIKRRFLLTGIDASKTHGISISYGPERTFDTVATFGEGDKSAGLLSPDGWLSVDALITGFRDTAILLPVADCVATVVYDPKAAMIGVLHLGRHSSIAHLIESFHSKATSVYGSHAHDWLVWMSPSLQAGSNVLDYFTPDSPDEWTNFMSKRSDGKVEIDIPAHNKQRFELLGVQPDNIEISPVDTYADERYFSHRAAVEKNQPERDGRMVVVAKMSKQANQTL